jgi:RHS repeat-associated protein
MKIIPTMRLRTSLLLSPLAIGLLLSDGVHAQTYSKTEAITYYDNTAVWVLGQTESVTCIGSTPSSVACDGADSGDVVSSATYDAATALPKTISAFGKLRQTLTYDTTSAVSTGQRGTFKSVSDARDTGTFDTTVVLSTWKRGIPQSIALPDTGAGIKYKSAVVDDLGQILSTTDETGAKTCYGYDAMGRVNKITYPSETALGVCDTSNWAATTITFDDGYAAAFGMPAGHWRQMTLTGNGRKMLVFDALWRPVVEQTTDLGNVTATTSEVVRRYDSEGRVVFESYPLNSGGLVQYNDTTLTGTDTSYDELGRVESIVQDSEIGPLTTTTAYQTGFKTQVTNPRGYATTTDYLTWDQPSTDIPVAISYPSIGLYVDIARDPFGKPTSITRRNASSSLWLTRSYSYNGYQELCRTTEPETDATLMGYDAAGNLAWSASGLPVGTACDAEGDTAAILARKAVRTHDQRNRISTLSFPDGKGDTTYDYTPDGLVGSLVAMDGTNIVTTNYTYNNRRLLTNEQMLWGNINWNLGYTYTANGFLASQSYVGGLTVDYSPNALGQPTKAGTYATGVSYYPNGAIKQFTYGNGIVHTMTPNTRQLPDRSLDAYGTSKIIDHSYDYDQVGNVLAISDGISAANNRDMAYDSVDRLLSATSTGMWGGAFTYTYDLLDNIQTVARPGQSLRYCYDTHRRLTFIRNGSTSCSDGAATTSLTYDLQGNLASKNNVTYAFDYGNRLRSTSGGAVSSYVYDGNGRRVRDYTTASKYSLYGQSGQLGITTDTRKAENTNYIYLAGSLVATRTWPTGTNGPYTIKYQHTDALGSPVAVTDANRVVIERYVYEPYGKSSSPDDKPGYTGHVEDAATGLTYMQQRYYDPGIGRFLSVDPVTADGNTGGNFNRYWYANNNPYKFTDPDGRQSRCAGSSCQVVNLLKGVADAAGFVSDKAEAVAQKAEKIDVRLEVAGAYGPGGKASVSLMRGDVEVSFVPVGQGADVNISLQPRDPSVSANFADKPVDAPIQFGGEAKAGAIVHFGFEGTFNPGGSVEGTPSVGIGVGEFTSYSPAIKIFEWKPQEEVNE